VIRFLCRNEMDTVNMNRYCSVMRPIGKRSPAAGGQQTD
jgi:hypothetical protein